MMSSHEFTEAFIKMKPSFKKYFKDSSDFDAFFERVSNEIYSIPDIDYRQALHDRLVDELKKMEIQAA